MQQHGRIPLRQIDRVFSAGPDRDVVLSDDGRKQHGRNLGTYEVVALRTVGSSNVR